MPSLWRYPLQLEVFSASRFVVLKDRETTLSNSTNWTVILIQWRRRSFLPKIFL